jgi:Domain of unknown function (DUF4258)
LNREEIEPRYTKHALDRMLERRISKDEVLAVLMHPHDSTPGRRADIIAYLGSVGRRRLRVVVRQHENARFPLVITVMERNR